MSAMFYTINQWSLWKRLILLFVSLFTLFLAWYFFLERPFLENNKVIFEQQKQDQVLSKEFMALLGIRANFVYKNQLHSVQLKPIFQNAISSNSDLVMKSYVENPVIALPAGASQFAKVATVLNISLFNAIYQSSATITFSSRFDNFVAYLEALQGQSQGIYFDSVEFNMNRYPKAEVIMKVFTLEGA